MLHNVTHPICLHDLMWWFVNAMNQNSDIATEDNAEEADVCILYVYSLSV